ncbi:MAG TPA: hypothetical protein GXX23_02645 [Firmicutes bacterium]|nr:hypothetical protein [Candidatus Fermentithermobacillaceae bacterium]
MSLSVTFRGTPNALTRALRKCAMRGLSLPADRDKVQRVLDREAKRAETMRILNISRRGGIA